MERLMTEKEDLLEDVVVRLVPLITSLEKVGAHELARQLVNVQDAIEREIGEIVIPAP